MPPSSEPDWQSLSDEQLDELVANVIEQNGINLSRLKFDDLILGLLENVAGFEGDRQGDARLLSALWSKYRDR